ncbi:hypothetical protein YC2023_077346 [Brassica napus]
MDPNNIHSQSSSLLGLLHSQQGSVYHENFPHESFHGALVEEDRTLVELCAVFSREISSFCHHSVSTPCLVCSQRLHQLGARKLSLDKLPNTPNPCGGSATITLDRFTGWINQVIELDVSSTETENHSNRCSILLQNQTGSLSLKDLSSRI